MRTNKLVASLAVAGCAVFASNVALAAPTMVKAGDIITLNSNSWGGANGGGEFLAKDGGISFQTFCIEYNEEFYYGQNLQVAKINTGAKNGGSGGAVNDPLGGKWDPISSETAYLYTKFSKQTLSNYDYGTAGTHLTEHKADSTALQLAFWYLEDEISRTVNTSIYSQYLANDHIGQEARAWVTEAQLAVASHQWTGLGNVRVLNLMKQDGQGKYTQNSQDQLYMMPIPEPETYAMMLAGLGLISYVAGRRRRVA